MSAKTNRAALSKVQTEKEYQVLRLNKMYPPYWDDGVVFYPQYKAGKINPHKRIMNFQRRMYRTWKYNRKTKWK